MPCTGSSATTFRHEALLYAGTDGFMAGTLPFIRDAVAADEAILVAVDRAKIALLREALRDDAHRVAFADMLALGENPARILPAWHDFVDAHTGDGRRMRGIGEPVWPERTALELAECHCHESLLNKAFAGRDDFWLVCPYDVSALGPDALATACETHPVVVEDGTERASSRFRADDDPLAAPLAEPGVEPAVLEFDLRTLREVRAFVAGHATSAGLTRARVADLLVAANEAATNSVRHGGGSGELRVWQDDGALVCEVRDRGRITDPLVGRRRPDRRQIGGYGVWMVNQLCDLVQLRSSVDGNVVRMFVRR